MKRIKVAPTRSDRTVARQIAKHPNPSVEAAFKAITYCADEHILLTGAALHLLAAFLISPGQRRVATHLAASAVVASVLPHLLKLLVAQERPDRCMMRGKRRGIPHSGRAWDAFPSGHAMHVGALAAALVRLYPASTPFVLAGSAAIAASRVILLAHWLSDVIVGLAGGVAIEGILWRLEERYFLSGRGK
jgi:membrane-associated phospholipid phosphatase